MNFKEQRRLIVKLAGPTASLVFGLMLPVIALDTSAQTRPRSRTRTQSKSVSAHEFPGGDLGAKINAADRALGAGAGEIVVRSGGTISTQVVLSSDHTLRLGAGTYVTTTKEAPILMQPRSSLFGAGWDTIIVESRAPGQFTVISAYNHARLNGSADSDLLIRDVQVKGANPGFNSAPQAISLGNCSRCTVDKVWINGTRSIGVQLGGSGDMGNFAQDSKVINSQFTHVASQNLALVNGKNILFEGNRFLAPGQTGGPGSTAIDLEVNGANDRIENVIIRNNTIDARGSGLPTSGNGIVIQATTGTPYVGPIMVENNTIIGGETQGTVTNVMSNAIYAFGGTMRDVTIRNNNITRTGQAGINLEGTRFKVINNKLRDVGGGGIPGFIVSDVTNSEISNNSLTYSGTGPIDNRIVITRSSRGNVYRNNTGFVIEGTVR
jgi:Right handed beta helix region